MRQELLNPRGGEASPQVLDDKVQHSSLPVSEPRIDHDIVS